MSETIATTIAAATVTLVELGEALAAAATERRSVLLAGDVHGGAALVALYGAACRVGEAHGAHTAIVIHDGGVLVDYFV